MRLPKISSSVLALIVANIVPLAGVLFLGACRVFKSSNSNRLGALMVVAQHAVFRRRWAPVGHTDVHSLVIGRRAYAHMVPLAGHAWIG